MHRLPSACVVVVLATVFAGCLSPRTYVPTMRYAVNPGIEVPRAEPTGRVLGVRLIEAGRPFNQDIVYFENPTVLRTHEHVEWAELPSVVVTRALVDAIEATGRFSDVGFAIDIELPDLILTGQLRKFDELRTETPWVAECEVRLELREVRSGGLVWADTLTAREPLAGESLPELAIAMGKSVSTIVEAAANAMAQAPLPSRQ
jgi:ABC-type uncharacterized transport system auxiliary subunit